MPSDPIPVEIAPTPYFQKNLKALSKRYRGVRSDLQPLITQLQAGELPGDKISGVTLTLFKVRIKNSNIQKGKSAGYRVVYYIKTQRQIVLVTIYSKSDSADIDVNKIKEVLAEYE